MKKIVVIGGSAAGAKAAAKARRLDYQAEITVIQKDPDLSMAACGYPYYIGGVFNDRNMLLATPAGVVRDAQFFSKVKNIKALTETEAVGIDRAGRTVRVRDLKTAKEESLDYDRLIIATGARARPLAIPGTDLDGVCNLLSMADADYLRKMRDGKKVKQAVVIGGGLIGVETCEALVRSGIAVTLLEMTPHILPFLDQQLAMLVENHMRSRKVQVLIDCKVDAILGEKGKVTGIRLADASLLSCDLVVVAVGVIPNSQLAQAAGIALGETGGVMVNAFMQTSDPDIYAAGDCVEVENLITGRKVLAPMGDLANLQGRVAGENAVSGNAVTFKGVVQTGICKVFDFAAGLTGLSEKAAHRAGIGGFETIISAGADKPGFMGANMLVSKILVEKKSLRILGYQCVGSGDVSRQLATAAMAVQGKITLDDLCCADLPYAPPFSPAIDPFIVSAHIMQNKLKGRIRTISAAEVLAMTKTDNPPFLLDGRGPDEYEQLRLGIGEKYIPLGALRAKLSELPQDKEQAIICFCKISMRGYEAALILEANGWKNVRVLEGGIAAWPYPRAK
ncbi:MAG: FAD-dependent oxidoreductase [Desulfocapsaceae bacterium]|nr:FAD-dependent oxidoreductase [Desulfocapsaceae bacterium]